MNGAALLAGDTVLFKGGATFTTPLTPRAGQPGQPVTYGSYGGSQAVLDGGNAAGAASGIDLTAGGGHDVVVQDLEVRNFGYLLRTPAAGAGTPRVTLQRCNLHDCQMAVNSTHPGDVDWVVIDNAMNQAAGTMLSLYGDRALIARNAVTNAAQSIAGTSGIRYGGDQGIVRNNNVGFVGGTSYAVRLTGSDNLCELNVVHDAAHGIAHTPYYGYAGVTRIRYNRLYAISGVHVRVADTALGGQPLESFVLAHNTLRADGSAYGFYVQATRGFVALANNLLTSSTALTNVLRVEALPAGGLVERSNLWFQSGSPTFHYNGTNIGSLGAYQAASGQGQGDIYADPLLGTSPGLIPGAASPALNVGVTALPLPNAAAETWERLADLNPMHYDGFGPDLGAVQVPVLQGPAAYTPPERADALPKPWQDDAAPTSGLPATPQTADAVRDLEVRAFREARRQRDLATLEATRRRPAVPLDPAPPKAPLAGDLPGEQQTITYTGTVTGGTFTLTWGGQTTAAIAWNAAASTPTPSVQSALEALSSVGTGNVRVTGSPGAWVVTFAGRLAGANAAAITAATGTLTGVAPGLAIAETFPVRVATDGPSLLALLTGGSALTVPGGIVLADGVYDNASYFPVTLGHKIWGQRAFDATVLTAGLYVNPAAGTLDGFELHNVSFQVTAPAKTFASECVHVSASCRNAVIEDVVCDGGSSFLLAVGVRAYGTDNLAVRRVQAMDYNGVGIMVVDPAMAQRQLITLTGATGGSLTLRLLGQETAAIAWNAAAATVQTALQALAGVGAGQVTVTGGAGGPWTVTWAGTLDDQLLDPLEANANGLTGTTPTVTVAVSPRPAQLEDLDVTRIYGIGSNAAQTLGGFGPGNPASGAANTGEYGVQVGVPATLSRVRVSDVGYAGLRLDGSCRNAAVSDVSAVNAAAAGIYLGRTVYQSTLQRLAVAGRTVAGVVVEGPSGSPLAGPAQVTIRDGLMAATTYGVELRSGAADVTVEGLAVTGCRLGAGVQLSSAQRALVRACDFTGLATGVVPIQETDTGAATWPANAGNRAQTNAYGPVGPRATTGQLA